MRLSRVGRALALAAALLALPAAAAETVPGSAELSDAVDRIVASTPLGDSRAGIFIWDLEKKRVVYESGADQLLNPASNMKLLTTIAALSRLGPSYRYPTEVFVQDLSGGVVRGNLFVRGKGDPSLDTQRLYRLVRVLKLHGLKEVKGDLVVDDSFFDSQYDGPGWEQDDSDRPYMAGAGALSLNFNAVEIHVRPAEKTGARAIVQLEPPSDYFSIENAAETAPPRARRRINVRSIPQGKKQRIVVSGRIPVGASNTVTWRRISHPPQYTGESLKAMLAEQGIRVRGKVRQGKVPENLRPYHVEWSEPLAVLVHTVNKWSQNHMTEMLLKTLGAEQKGEPGTWGKGAAAVEDFLAEEVGIPRGTFVMRNGSGLNDVNRLSARQLVKVLDWAWGQSLVAPELLTSLPVAGIDGTTRNRMLGTAAEGRIRAKTGTLQNVTALSGYVEARGGGRYAFAILVNDYPGRAYTVIPGVDAIGAAIAGVGTPGSADAAVAFAQPPARDASTPSGELAVRLSTFHHLLNNADAENADFLRTSLRTERDPALRAAIAEALQRTEGGEGGRVFLEHFDPSPEVFGRWLEAARAASLPTPALDTLIDLAAEGSEEALGYVLSLGALYQAEPLQDELARGLAEIGRTAPEELLGVLNVSTPELQASAIRLLGRVINAPANEPHPFSIALARAARGADPTLAGLAKTLEMQLEEARPGEDEGRAESLELVPES